MTKCNEIFLTVRTSGSHEPLLEGWVAGTEAGTFEGLPGIPLELTEDDAIGPRKVLDGGPNERTRYNRFSH